MNRETMMEMARMYVPNLMKDAKFCREGYYGELEIELTNGEVWSFDAVTHFTRQLPSNDDLNKKDIYSIEFGKRLRRIMEVYGVMQKDVARDAGLTAQQLSSYANGEHIPSIYIAEKIAAAIGCDVEAFICRR